MTRANHTNKQEDDNGKCPICGSTNRVRGATHHECGDCGLLIEERGPDPGFTPASGDPRGLRARARGRGTLGSTIAPSSDPKHRRLRRSHQRQSTSEPKFLDLVIGELVGSCDSVDVAVCAADILDSADAVKPLGRVRKKMVGAQGIAADETREYKTRVYAAASLHITNDEGQSNTAPQLAKNWGIRYRDLVWAIRFLNRHRRTHCGEPREPPSERRSRQLRHELDRLRSFLVEQVGALPANEVIEVATEVLRSQMEPIYPDDAWYTGAYCNYPSPRAAFAAVVVAIAELGLPNGLARRLYERLPITGMKHFIERSADLFDE